MANSDAKGFGAALRTAREAAGRDIRDLAEVTRIQARYIEALESEDWHAVPPGVIGRGFVRVLARELGVPPEDLSRLYRAARGDEDAEPERSLPEVDWKVDLGGGRRKRPLLIAVAAAALLLAALWRWAPWGGERSLPPLPPEEGADTGPALAPPGDRAEPPPAPSAAAKDAAPPTPAPPVPSVAPTIVPQPAAAATGSLEIEARGRVWVRVQPAGAAAQERVLKAGERVAFPGAAPFALKVSDGGAVRLFWNGQALGAAGPASQVASIKVPAGSER